MAEGRAAQHGIDDRDVRVFLVLARELHFARTGDIVGVSASRVSQVIRRLERRIGGELVSRTSRQVVLTPLGEHFVERVAPTIAATDRALAEVRQHSDNVRGVLHIGTYSPLSLLRSLDELIAPFEQAHPSASVTIRELPPHTDLLTALRDEQIDILWARTPIRADGVVTGPTITDEPRIALLARDHPLAVHESLTWEQIGQYPVTDNPKFPRDMMDRFVPPRTPSGRLIERRSVESVNDIVRATAAGLIVHPTVPTAIRPLAHPHIVARPITDLARAQTALFWLERRADDLLISAAAGLAGEIFPREAEPESR